MSLPIKSNTYFSYKYFLKNKPKSRVSWTEHMGKDKQQDQAVRLWLFVTNSQCLCTGSDDGQRPWVQHAVQESDPAVPSKGVICAWRSNGITSNSIPCIFTSHLFFINYMLTQDASMNVYRRNVRKIKISVKASKHARSNEHVCSF